ncbi:Nucleotide-binding universal stress protein, UspA family [Mucilaginibacter sp. OK268]|uniref:universal stress protein n=1 Tax=Mucilaginibacter sp. OK268 TaxID=1881048 RepID=UPI00088DE4F9|nr:universal stress protein [Mucilaginibacter sp. OK268]SDP97127.1 Nucleotide-binding universal stress protein, UspA family [Mucilaginibacter sp. OK268]
MKTILMLTDFSENANHAAKTATKVLRSLNADILLYNTYYDHPILSAYSGGPWVVEGFVFQKAESIAKLSQLTLQLRHIIAGISKDGFEPKTDYQCGEGPLGRNTAVIIEENKAGLVVIGGSTNGSLNHLIFGSDTMDVIDHSFCPVLIIPPKAEMNQLKKVTLAIDFELADINAINYLTHLGKQLNFQLEIVHVSVLEEKDDPVKEKAILNHIHAIKQDNITYLEIRGKDVVKRLNRLCKDSGSDMLALVHYQDGFLPDLFDRSTTAAVLYNQHIPLMVLPSEMK